MAPTKVDRRGELRCKAHNHRGDSLVVERSVVRRKLRGKARLSVNVYCPDGCEWRSFHPAAIARSRAADAAATPTDARRKAQSRHPATGRRRTIMDRLADGLATETRRRATGLRDSENA